MADIFRLLSRSTSFAKGAFGGSNISQSRHATTRKAAAAAAAATANSDAVPTELDFFGMGSQPRKRKKRDDEEIASEPPAVETDVVDPVLESEDAIRKVLAQHKLRFTILSDTTTTATATTTATTTTTTTTEKKKKKKKKQQQSLLVPPLTSFAQLRSPHHGYALSKRVYENILQQGYTAPTEVQMGALPVLMRKGCVVGGEIDLLTCAPTGSGKTLAYVVPLLDGILVAREKGVREKGVKAVVVAPTKELAAQIVNEIMKLAVGTGVKVSLMRKGMAATSAKGESAGIHVTSDILVSTPLLLLHAIESEEGKAEFGKVRRLVLDEADVLLDELFKDQTLGIWKALREIANNDLRTSLWSATISSGTEEVARDMMLSSTTTNALPPTLLRFIVGIKDTALPTVHQTLIYTATEPGKLLALRQLFTTSFHPPALIFVQSVPRAQALYAEILYDLPTPGRIAVLHASLTDTARADTMSRFQRGEVWVLITTDLLARGVDFRGVRLVVNYDIPTTVVAYIHRVGRTGRAGAEDGCAVTYYTKEDVGYVKGIANVIAVAQKVKGAAVGEGVQKWLLDALPKTSKRERKLLKKRGVEARGGGAEGKKSRISTKSGYERQKTDARRGAVEASKKRKLVAELEGDSDGDQVAEDGDGDDGEVFGGIEEEL